MLLKFIFSVLQNYFIQLLLSSFNTVLSRGVFNLLKKFIFYVGLYTVVDIIKHLVADNSKELRFAKVQRLYSLHYSTLFVGRKTFTYIKIFTCSVKNETFLC